MFRIRGTTIGETIRGRRIIAILLSETKLLLPLFLDGILPVVVGIVVVVVFVRRLGDRARMTWTVVIDGGMQHVDVAEYSHQIIGRPGGGMTP